VVLPEACRSEELKMAHGLPWVHILVSLQYFAIYLEAPSDTVVVYTDHNPLVFLSKMKNHNQRLVNWSLNVQNFYLEIKHIQMTMDWLMIYPGSEHFGHYLYCGMDIDGEVLKDFNCLNSFKELF
jgi:hypothetical protein